MKKWRRWISYRSNLPKPYLGTKATERNQGKRYKLRRNDVCRGVVPKGRFRYRRVKARAKRQKRIQRSGEEDKKNTKKPKCHTEVSTSLPRPICEEKHKNNEASYRGDASVPKHQRLSAKRHNGSRVSFRYFWDFPPWTCPINTHWCLGVKCPEFEREIGAKNLSRLEVD